MKHDEFNIQKMVCQYLSAQYPDVLFLSDTIASCKLTIPQANRNKQVQKQGFKCPDLIILQPNHDYCGLFIELKTQSPFKADGNLKKSDHLRGQSESIGKLLGKGYKAVFAWGFDMAKNIIDEYLNDQA